MVCLHWHPPCWTPRYPVRTQAGLVRKGQRMHAVGVDIGGTKIAAGVVDEDGAIIAKARRDTSARDAAGIDRAIAEVVEEFSEDFEFDAIGLAAAGFASSDREHMVFGPNIAAWRDYPLAAKVRDLVERDVAVVVENDANAAGWAEFVYGAGRGTSNDDHADPRDRPRRGDGRRRPPGPRRVRLRGRARPRSRGPERAPVRLRAPRMLGAVHVRIGARARGPQGGDGESRACRGHHRAGQGRSRRDRRPARDQGRARGRPARRVAPRRTRHVARRGLRIARRRARSRDLRRSAGE